MNCSGCRKIGRKEISLQVETEKNPAKGRVRRCCADRRLMFHVGHPGCVARVHRVPLLSVLPLHDPKFIWPAALACTSAILFLVLPIDCRLLPPPGLISRLITAGSMCVFHTSPFRYFAQL